MKEKEIVEYLRGQLIDPDSVGTNPVMRYMAFQCYEMWYKQEVSPNLSDKDKLALGKKILDLYKKGPIFLPSMYYPHSQFPEIKSFSHDDKFSGMQLYVVVTEIAKELGFVDLLSASELTLIDVNQEINPAGLKLKEIRDKITTRQQKLGV